MGTNPAHSSFLSHRPNIDCEGIMDTVVAYLISLGLVAFGGWILFAGAKTSPSSLLFWTLVALTPVVVGLFSLISEMRSDKTER